MDLKTTPIFRLFLSYFIPSFIGMAVLSSYVVVDGIFVANGIGEDGLSAIGIVFPIFSFFIGIELLLGIGGGALVGVTLGHRKFHKARVIFSSVIYFSISFGVILGILIFIFRDFVARMLGANDTLMPLVLPYLSVIALGAAIILFQSILCSFARNDKAPNLVMFSLILGTIVNIILNYLFIFVFKWGMFGSALSTILGHFVGLIVILKHFICKNGDLYFTKHINFNAIIRSAKSGISSSVGEFAFGFTYIMMNLLLMKVSGKDGVAILGILMYIGVFCFASILSISHGLQPIVSYNFGARNLNRIRQTFYISLIFAIVVGILIYGILFFGIPFIAKIFLDSNSQILDDLVQATRIYFLGYLFLGINIIISAFLQAIGRNTTAIITSLLYNLLFLMLLPLGANLYNINGIWSSYPLALFLACVISAFIIKKELSRLKVL